MAVQTLFGWGGVKIVTQEFPTAFGTIGFEQVFVRNTTVAGKHIQHFKGWRAVIECTLFNDGSDASILKFQTLAMQLSLDFYANTAFQVQPRYTSTDAGSVAAFNCFLDSDFAPEDWANVNVGQSLKLKFIGEELLLFLPDNYSNQVNKNIIDESGKFYVDESGSQYQMF